MRLAMQDPQKPTTLPDEAHDYYRHLVTTTVGWFTFFVTVNYVVMGWLGSSEGFRNNSVVVWWLSALFITQNILGLLVLRSVRRYCIDFSQQVRQLSEPLHHDMRVFPFHAYERAFILAPYAIVSLLITWVALPIVVTTAQ